MVLSCIWFEGELENLEFALVGEVQNLGYFGDIANEILMRSSTQNHLEHHLRENAKKIAGMEAPLSILRR